MPLMWFLRNVMSFNSVFHKKNTQKKKNHPTAYSLERRAAACSVFSFLLANHHPLIFSVSSFSTRNPVNVIHWVIKYIRHLIHGLLSNMLQECSGTSNSNGEHDTCIPPLTIKHTHTHNFPPTFTTKKKCFLNKAVMWGGGGLFGVCSLFLYSVLCICLWYYPVWIIRAHRNSLLLNSHRQEQKKLTNYDIFKV